MSDWNSIARQQGLDDAGLEARHELLIDLLAAYLDGELPAETRAQIDAHLVGCARCRRELRLQDEVRRRLGTEPPMAAAPELQSRILAAVAAAPAPVFPPPERRRLVPRSVVAIALVALATVAGASAAWRAAEAPRPAMATHALAARAATVPLFADVLADYRNVTRGDLPGRARDLDVVRGAVPFAVEALRAPGLRLVGAWTTELGEDPAVVLAYRSGDRVVLEYLVPEERFFRPQVIRDGVAGGRMLRATDDRQGLVAWAVPSAGAILVGELPLGTLEQIPEQDRLARRVGRGAE